MVAAAVAQVVLSHNKARSVSMEDESDNSSFLDEEARQGCKLAALIECFAKFEKT